VRKNDAEEVALVRLGVEAALVEGNVVAGDVVLDGAIISEIGVISPSGSGLAVPGFIDVQVNGFARVDFANADVDGYSRAATALAATGVTTFQPTFITLPAPRYLEALAVASQVDADRLDARLHGVHLEGPFLSPQRKGAHDPANMLAPDPELARSLVAAGPLTHVTLAPELPGALDLIDLLTAAGVTVGIGHSDATAEEARAAIERGASSVTHLFNAQSGIHHREPGLSGAALAHESVIVTIIVDGVHLADDVVRLVFAAAPGRVALITDAIEAAGVGNGTFMVGDREVTVSAGAARLGDGTLAGGVATMDQVLRNVVDLGVPLVVAIEAATAVPARLIGRPDLGVLRPGAPADIVVLDDSLQVRRTLLGGRETFRGE
jgi:N-acetylglucosamine-6-phosphate deacetylase